MALAGVAVDNDGMESLSKPVSSVELTAVNGRPLDGMTREELVKVVRELGRMLVEKENEVKALRQVVMKQMQHPKQPLILVN